MTSWHWLQSLCHTDWGEGRGVQEVGVQTRQPSGRLLLT